MKKQILELRNEKIQTAFVELKAKYPERLQRRLNLSWSNWGFGLESLAESAARLQRAGICYIELHGNHYLNVRSNFGANRRCGLGSVC